MSDSMASIAAASSARRPDSAAHWLQTIGAWGSHEAQACMSLEEAAAESEAQQMPTKSSQGDQRSGGSNRHLPHAAPPVENLDKLLNKLSKHPGISASSAGDPDPRVRRARALKIKLAGKLDHRDGVHEASARQHTSETSAPGPTSANKLYVVRAQHCWVSQ